MPKNCKTRSNNHKDFQCDDCNEWFMSRDDSELNVCFNCQLFLCDDCFNKHMKEEEVKVKCYSCDNIIPCDESVCDLCIEKLKNWNDQISPK